MTEFHEIVIECLMEIANKLDDISLQLNDIQRHQVQEKLDRIEKEAVI